MQAIKPTGLSTADENELRLLCAEIEHRRRVNPLQFYSHLPQQKLFHDDAASIKCLFGGNRAGKTQELAEYIIHRALSKPRQRIWACSTTFADSVSILQRKIWELIPKNRIKYGHYDEINGWTNRKTKMDNNSLIHYKSYDQGVESFAQDDCDLIANDEEPDNAIVKEQRMRLIDRNGEMIFSMTSTKGVTDFIVDVFEDSDILKTRYSEVLCEDLPVIVEKNGIKIYLIWSTDNPYVDSSRLQGEIRLMSREEIKARVYGIPINICGKIYITFNRKIHIIPFEDAPVNNITLFHVLDPHDAKPWAMAWFIADKTGAGYCVDEYPNRNFNEMVSDDKTYDDYAGVIRQKEEALEDIYGVKVYRRIIDPNYGNKTIRKADREGGQSSTTIKKEMARRGIYFRDGIDIIEDGHLKVREKLDYKTAASGEITKQPQFLITDNCPNMGRHLSRYSRDENGNIEEKYKDFCDLTRYFWMSNPRYVDPTVLHEEETKRVY